MTVKDQIKERTQQVKPAHTTEIRAWVADLRAYNQGHLEGFWMNCTSDPDVMRDKIQAFLQRQSEKHGEKREEYAIHDWEGPFRLKTEHPDWDEIAELVEMLETYCDPNMVKAARELEIPIDKMEDAYVGQAQSVTDYFARQAEDMGIAPDEDDILSGYIDWDAYARDMLCSGEYAAVQVSYDTVYIFTMRY